jgi:hypothetical protein
MATACALALAGTLATAASHNAASNRCIVFVMSIESRTRRLALPRPILLATAPALRVPRPALR